MAYTQLKLYNNTLLLCGSESLADLTEEREPRFKLDQVWDNGSFIDELLEEGDWNFAIRTIEIDYNPAISPDFGFPYCFDKPEDWVRTAGISADGNFNEPLRDYEDEAGKWWANIDKIFVRVVSNDTEYGADMSKWPMSFRVWAEHRMATKVYKRLSQAKADYESLKEDEERKLRKARGKDARNQAVVYPPRGSWSRARSGRVFYDRKEGR